MIDHVVVRVQDFARSRKFYLEALAPLGYTVAKEYGGGVGFGPGGKILMWIASDEPKTAAVHVAFTAKDRRTVDAFHAAALKAGGRDHGAPGVRAHYHPHYYGAFVLDPDGNNIEAVCHEPRR